MGVLVSPGRVCSLPHIFTQLEVQNIPPPALGRPASAGRRSSAALGPTLKGSCLGQEGFPEEVPPELGAQGWDSANQAEG